MASSGSSASYKANTRLSQLVTNSKEIKFEWLSQWPDQAQAIRCCTLFNPTRSSPACGGFGGGTEHVRVFHQKRSLAGHGGARSFAEHTARKLRNESEQLLSVLILRPWIEATAAKHIKQIPSAD